MAGKSDYLEDKINDHVLGATAYTAPATIYIALFTAAPSDSGGGTEVSGSNYSRKAVTNNTTNWPSSASGVKTLNVAQTFATPSGSWGTVTHFALFDASSAGNLLYWNALTASQTISSGNTVTFGVGSITVTED